MISWKVAFWVMGMGYSGIRISAGRVAPNACGGAYRDHGEGIIPYPHENASHLTKRECLNKWVNEIDEMKSIVWKLTAFELAMVVAINE